MNVISCIMALELPDSEKGENVYLALGNISENFRNIRREEQEIDPNVENVLSCTFKPSSATWSLLTRAGIVCDYATFYDNTVLENWRLVLKSSLQRLTSNFIYIPSKQLLAGLPTIQYQKANNYLPLPPK